MKELLENLNQSGWHALTAISTLAIAFAAVVSALLTKALIAENRLLREAGAPKVVAYLAHHPHLWEFFNFVLANVGRGPAKNVSFRFLSTDKGGFESHGVVLGESAERTPFLVRLPL